MAQVVDVKMVDNKAEILAASKQQIFSWLEAIGEDAAGTAAKFAPVDTGRLKNSISSAVVEEEQAVYVGTNVEYAIYHEFGTGTYAEGGGGRQEAWMYQDKDGNWHWTHGVPAKHFIQFGCQAHQDQYKQMLEEKLKQ